MARRGALAGRARRIDFLTFGYRRRDVVVILQPVNLRWVQGAADDPKDLAVPLLKLGVRLLEVPAMDGFRVTQLDHVELFVPDRDAAAAWYARTLGLQVVPKYASWAADPQGPLMITTAHAGTIE
jgi:hypothetical protein